MANLWQFEEGHPKPAFSEKVQRGDQKKFFKNGPKSSPHLKGPTALWRKCNYPLISMQLKCKDWTKFWRKKALQNCPNGQGMEILAGSPKTSIFWKSLKGGRREIFQKSPKSSPRLKGLKALWRKWHYRLISMHLKCKDWKRFWRKKRLQRVPEWPSYCNFCKVTQNPHFLKKCKGGTERNFSKIVQKVALT